MQDIPQGHGIGKATALVLKKHVEFCRKNYYLKIWNLWQIPPFFYIKLLLGLIQKVILEERIISLDTDKFEMPLVF